MKRILYVTGSRAEYGIMSRLLKRLQDLQDIHLEIVIIGMHLLEEYGSTYKQVEKDFPKAIKIDIGVNNRNQYDTLHSMSIAMEKFAYFFQNKKYDALLLLGDRYEILPVAIVAAMYNIPIIHIHGGEKTLGNYDEFIRHSITKMSRLHLVATEEYRKRVIQLGEHPDTVKNLGSLGVANTLEYSLISQEEIQKKIGNPRKPYFVILFHPETITGVSLEEQTQELVFALEKLNKEYHYVFIGSNADTGSDTIRNILQDYIKKYGYSQFESLSPVEYFSLLRDSMGLIGNSSSGIIEAPSFGIPTINIGERQLGRVKGESIIDCTGNADAIVAAIRLSQTEAMKKKIKKSKNPYYQANSLEKYVLAIREFLEHSPEYLKDFYDLKFEILL